MRDFCMDVDKDQRTDGIGGRQVTDRSAILIPVCRRVKLGAILVGRDFVRSGNETVFAIFKLLADAYVARYIRTCCRRLELGVSKTGPDRNGRRKGVCQINVLAVFQLRLIDSPQIRLLGSMPASGE